MIVRLRFADRLEAIRLLSDRCFQMDDLGNETPWDCVQTPYTSYGGNTAVVVNEPVKLDENGEPLPSTWVGFHVDLILFSDYPEIQSFIISPMKPCHSFGE